MKEIEEWLRGNRDYYRGVHLYAMFGKYQSVVALLKRGESELNRGKLLDSLLRTLNTAKTDIEKIAAQITDDDSNQKIEDKKDAYLISIDKKWKPMYAEMSTMHARLLAVETKEMRYALAVRITDIHSVLIDLWNERDHYMKTGKRKEKLFKRKAKENLSDSELRKLLSLRANLSAYEKHRLPSAQARLSTEPNAKNKKNLERTIAAIEKYRAAIKNLQQDGD